MSNFSKLHILQIIFLASFFLSNTVKAQIVFQENFDEEEATTGTDEVGGVAWESDCPDCADAADFMKVHTGRMTGQDTNGPATWTTDEIDISSCDQISISFDLTEEGTMEGCGTGCNSVDWVRFEYNINGAGWEDPAVAEFCPGDCAGIFVIQSDDMELGESLFDSGCLPGGETVQLRITVQAWAASERWRIDNVIVSCEDGPELFAGEDQTICAGEELTLTAENPDGVIIEWNNDVEDGVPFIPEDDIYVVSGELSGCVARDTVEITLIESPEIEIEEVPDFTVSDDSYFISAIPAGGVWSSECGGCIDAETGEFDPSIAGAGVWEVCYQAGDEPCTNEVCIDILVSDDAGCVLDGEIISNPPTCFGFSDGSVTINMTGATGDVIYEIKNEDDEVLNVENSNTANGLNEGWYYFTILDDGPCEFVDSVYLDDPDQMSIELETINPRCHDDYTGTAWVDTVYNATGDYNSIDFIWSPNPNGDNGIGEDTLFEANAGTYNLLVNDENGCSIAIDFELKNPAELKINNLGYEPAYCRLYGYQSGNGLVYADAIGGTPDYDYLWENLSNGDVFINTTWGGLNPGNYKITVTDNNDCVVSELITVDSLNPIADFEMTSDQFSAEWEGTSELDVNFVNLSDNFANPNNPFADTAFFWSFGMGGYEFSDDYYETFNMTYANAGDYEVCLVATNKNGCTDTTCRTITVFDPFIFTPVNTFTPNNDGINDVFTFDVLSQSIDQFECVIVNRWGNVVIEFNDISDMWDGRMKSGSDAAQGTYFYNYRGVSDNGTNFEGQGTIQLLR